MKDKSSQYLLIIYHVLGIILEKAMAPHSSTLAWKIPWMEEPGGLQSMGSLRVGHDWTTSLSLFTFMHWRRKWQPTPVFPPGEFQGRGSLVGCCLWGRRVRHECSDLAAAAATSLKWSYPHWHPSGCCLNSEERYAEGDWIPCFWFNRTSSWRRALEFPQIRQDLGVNTPERRRVADSDDIILQCTLSYDAKFWQTDVYVVSENVHAC